MTPRPGAEIPTAEQFFQKARELIPDGIELGPASDNWLFSNV